MPSPQIQFPAGFTTASALAYTNPDGSVQLVTTDNPIPVSMDGQGGGGSGLTDAQLRAAPVSVSMASFSGLTDAQLRATPVGTAPDAVTDGLRTSGSVTAASVLVSVPNTGFGGGSFHVTSAGTTCTITYEQSNDNTTWIALPVVSLAAANASPVLTTTAAGIYGFATTAAYVRARVSTYTSGTVALTLAQKRQATPVTGVSLAGGASALGSVSITGTPNVLSNVGTGYTDSMTALAASATFTGTGRALNTASQYACFHAIAYADQAGTLFVEQSLDTGATYQPVLTQAVAANSAAQVTARLAGSFSSATLFRVRYVNGAAAQTTFRLSSAFSR